MSLLQRKVNNAELSEHFSEFWTCSPAKPADHKALCDLRIQNQGIDTCALDEQGQLHFSRKGPKSSTGFYTLPPNQTRSESVRDVKSGHACKQQNDDVSTTARDKKRGRLTRVNVHRSFGREKDGFVGGVKSAVLLLTLLVTAVAGEDGVELAAEALHQTLRFRVRLALHAAAAHRVCVARTQGNEGRASDATNGSNLVSCKVQ